MTLFSISYLLLWIVAILLIPVSAILIYLLAELERQHRREGMGYGNNLIGRPFPSFSATACKSGSAGPIKEYRGVGHIVLAVSAGCNSCSSLVREISTMTANELADFPLIILCMGEKERCIDAFASVDLIPFYIHDIKVEETSDLWFAGFPAAIVINESGIVTDVRHPLSIKGVVAAGKSIFSSSSDIDRDAPGNAALRVS